MVNLLKHTWVYTNEVTQGLPLNDFRMGAGRARKTNLVIEGLEPWATGGPLLQGEEGHWMKSS